MTAGLWLLLYNQKIGTTDYENYQSSRQWFETQTACLTAGNSGLFKERFIGKGVYIRSVKCVKSTPTQ